MPDLTYEILTDREKFPDAAEITLADGQKVTVKQFRDAVLPKADFTRATEAAAREKQELASAVQGLQAQLQEALAAKTAAETPKPAAHPGKLTEEDLLADPVLGPLVSELKTAKQALTAHEERLKQHEDTWLRSQYLGQLSHIATRHNSRFNADGKGKAFDQKAFLDFVLDRKLTDLDVAYTAWSHPDAVALEVKQAEERGVERGRAAAKVPAVPFGRRRAPVKPQGLPGSLQELDDETVLADPEMQAAMTPTEEG